MKSILHTLLFVCCGLNLSTVYAMAIAEPCASQLFLSELDAVRAAADRYNPMSIRENREYMGAIFESQGRFGYTVTATSSSKDNWQLKIPRVDWDGVRAFWHTHGDASSHHRYFSDADTHSVKKFGLPFYLADYTGYLKVFRSGDRTLNPMAAARLNLPRKPGFAIGEFVQDGSNRVVKVKVREDVRSQNS